SRLQSQIDPDIELRGRDLSDRILHRHTQAPVPDRILGKAATLPPNTLEPLLLEHPEGLTGKSYAPALEFQLRSLERDPPEGALGSLAHPPPQLHSLELLAPRGKLGIDALNGFRAYVIKQEGGSGRQLVQ